MLQEMSFNIQNNKIFSLVLINPHYTSQQVDTPIDRNSYLLLLLYVLHYHEMSISSGMLQIPSSKIRKPSLMAE